jgi:hypothetical protein
MLSVSSLTAMQAPLHTSQVPTQSPLLHPVAVLQTCAATVKRAISSSFDVRMQSAPLGTLAQHCDTRIQDHAQRMPIVIHVWRCICDCHNPFGA